MPGAGHRAQPAASPIARGDAGRPPGQLRTLALLEPRWGYRPLYWLLRREGWHVNRKLVQRVCREDGLAVRQRRRKRVSVARTPRTLPLRPNERWGMDFVRDTLGDGRAFRALTIVDDFTRESVAIEVERGVVGEQSRHRDRPDSRRREGDQARHAEGCACHVVLGTNRGVVNYDAHGDAPGIRYHGYAKGTGKASDEGVLVAAFDGAHGWFWRNRGKEAVTVTLRTNEITGS